MKTKTNILIIEDEMIIARNLEAILLYMGYQNIEIAINYTEAIAAAKKTKPDLILSDINLKDGLSGIDAIEAIRAFHSFKLIYLTGCSEEVWNKAKKTNPDYYISKPFQAKDIRIAMDLVFKEELEVINELIPTPTAQEKPIFLKSDGKYIAINLENVLYVRALNNYIRVQTNAKQHLSLGTLMGIKEKLPPKEFFQVHRSYLIRLDKIESIEGYSVVIDRKVIPVSKAAYPDLIRLISLL